MNAAPFSTDNVPSTCVYSAQGNLVCQKSQFSDPVIPVASYSCGVQQKQKQVEKYMDFDLNSVKTQMTNMMNGLKPKEKYDNLKTNNLPPYDNLTTAMNMNYSVSPWPF
jgi:hypothetical protein